MGVNSTHVPDFNSTSQPASNAGLAAGLSVFFVLLVLAIVGGILTYKQFGKLRRVLSFGSRRRIQKEKDVCGEAPKIVKEIHENPSRPENNYASQTPIYENVARAGTGPSKKAPTRSASTPEDDVYLQCDAIYSNDPACNPPDSHQEDDTYILPDS